ncbi:MAG: glycosyltransferase family 2 protein, partial [Caldilineaceae bacterium]|nr:glycosyltransferase family 2 protein [Caldilineaceae bacterium]
MTEIARSRTLIVIPALDEAATISEVLAGVRRHAPGLDVLVVDDGSRDRTGVLARALGCDVLRHPFNLGHGAALQSGYRYAAERRYDHVVHLDGDGQHDPAGIPSLLAPLLAGEADVALGSRFLEGQRYPMSWLRRTTIGFFGWLVGRLTGLAIT